MNLILMYSKKKLKHKKTTHRLLTNDPRAPHQPPPPNVRQLLTQYFNMFVVIN